MKTYERLRILEFDKLGSNWKGSRQLAFVGLIRMFILLVMLQLFSNSAAFSKASTAPLVPEQATVSEIFLPFAGTDTRVRLRRDVRRHGGVNWGLERIGDDVYVGVGSDVVRYRPSEASRSKATLIHRAAFVPKAMYVLGERLLVVGSIEAALVSLRDPDAPALIWSGAEGVGLTREALKWIAGAHLCQSDAKSLLLCPYQNEIEVYRIDDVGIHAVGALPLTENQRPLLHNVGQGRAVVNLNPDGSGWSGRGIQILDLRGTDSIETEAVIFEGETESHGPVLAHGDWVFAAEHEKANWRVIGSVGYIFPSEHGLAIYQLMDGGVARRAAAIDLEGYVIVQLQVESDRLYALAQRYDGAPSALFVFDIARPDSPRVLSVTGLDSLNVEFGIGVRLPFLDSESGMLVHGNVGSVPRRSTADIYDVTDPEAPGLLARIPIDVIEAFNPWGYEHWHNSQIVRFARVGSLIVASAPEGLFLTDLATGRSDRLESVDSGITPVDVVVTGDGVVWVDSWQAGDPWGDRIEQFDDPALNNGKPSASMWWSESSPDMGVRPLLGVEGAVAMEQDGFMNIYDVDAVGALDRRGIARTAGFGHTVVQSIERDGLLWMIREDWPFIDVINLRDPTSPRYFDPIPLPSDIRSPTHFAVGHGRIYVNDPDSGVGVVDIVDAGSSSGQAVWADRQGELFVLGDRLLIADGDWVEIVDPTDLDSPRTVRWARFPPSSGEPEFATEENRCVAPVRSLALVGTVLYRTQCLGRDGAHTEDGRGRIDTIDLTDIHWPVTLDSIAIGHGGRIVAGSESAWIAAGVAGLIEVRAHR